MARRIWILLLAAALSFCATAEGLSQQVEEAPGELDEFELLESEPAPQATPEAQADATPLPTLEPGSLNYPPEKVNFEGEIWTILTRRWGLADFQAAGLMSSLYMESSFCPYNAQSESGVDNRGHYTYRTGDGVGFGLGQWTSPGRKAALRRFAIDHGDANLVWDFDIQMAFMGGEIDLGGLKATQTLYEATEWAVMCYERPNQAYENSWPGSRYAIARQIYQAYARQSLQEPEANFEIVDANGEAISVEWTFNGEGTLTVSSNYYWRLKAPAWLDVQTPQFYFPDEWEACACGYAGETQLRLGLFALPLVREGTLEFEVYAGSRFTRAVTVKYTGQTFQEAARDALRGWARIVSLIGRLCMDKSPDV